MTGLGFLLFALWGWWLFGSPSRRSAARNALEARVHLAEAWGAGWSDARLRFRAWRRSTRAAWREVWGRLG